MTSARQSDELAYAVVTTIVDNFVDLRRRPASFHRGLGVAAPRDGNRGGDGARASPPGASSMTSKPTAASARMNGHDGSNSHPRTLNLGARGCA